MRMRMSPRWWMALAACCIAAAIGGPSIAGHGQSVRPVVRWGVFEATFTSQATPANPLQDAELRVTFTAPSQRARTVHGFWDGGATWRVRFSPDEAGEWTYRTAASPEADAGIHGRSGRFVVTAAAGASRFDRHGPVRVAANRRYLEHADGTRFFWLADTAWNAALLSTPDEWTHYTGVRARQGFSAVQWVATQWRASPAGDRLNQLAFSGTDRISVNTEFFQRLDDKVTALNRAGLLSVPVLLWAIGSGSNPSVNPGFSLPDEQAIRLARYMVARWQAYDVIWILPGDGDYRGDKAEKWKRIGRAVFGDIPHAPVLLHPGGMHWVLREFAAEPWVDIHGYQSGHGDDDRTLRWMTQGPPSQDWTLEPARPFINLEPPYEYHVAYQSKQPITPEIVRRAVYWSLLNAPTAGVSYGGHGVWGWDDGTRTPTDHPTTGIPLPWKQALLMPGAEQMSHVAALFTSLDFSRLRPAPGALVTQPGVSAAREFITVAASDSGDLLVAYTPAGRAIALQSTAVPRGPAAWFDPRTGRRTTASAARADKVVTFSPPSDADWVLVIAG